MIITKVNLIDIDLLKEICIKTFSETFSSANSEEDMDKYLENNFSTKKLNLELIDKASGFYFAKIDNRVIGYLKINIGQSQTEIKSNDSLEIERIYVLKEFHGKNVGQALYEKAIEIAKVKRVKYVWLGVWEQNQRAIRFYQKNGFIPFDKHIFTLGDDKQTDILMKLILK